MIDDEPAYAVEPRPAYANLTDLLTRQAGLHPDREAVVEPRPDRRALTWAELEARVTAVAGGLSRRGLVAGHRVALVGPNSLEFVIGYLAVVRAGFVAVPLDPDLEPAELAAAVRDCGVALVLAAEGVADLDLHSATLPLTETGLAAVAAGGGSPVDSPPDPEALAALVHTAGSTGEPRPAMLSHRALLAHTEQADVLGFGPQATVLALLPLSGVFGLNAVLGGWLRSGARLVVLDRRRRDRRRPARRPPGPSLSPEAVVAHCAARLATFKRPAAVTVVDALPRGATGQVRKSRLRETVAAGVAR